MQPIQPIGLVKLGGRLTLRIAQIYVMVLLVWNVLRIYPGERWLVLQLGNYFAPWLFMSLIPVLFVAVLGRHRWLIGVTAILLLIFAGRYWYLFKPRPQRVSAENYASELRVMTFNVHFSNLNAQEIANLIQAEKPDIIAMQELSPVLAFYLLPELAAEYPHLLYDGSAGMQIALVSRYPLREQRKSESMRALHALIEAPTSTINIWNVHPYPGFSDGRQKQNQLLALVARDIAQATEPVIVLGDFNTTDQSENYHLLANPLIDVHHSVGRGFGFTFPVADLPYTMPWFLRGLLLIQMPLFRIDYILVSDHFIPYEIRIIPDGLGSDHLPIVATLLLANR